MNSIIRAVITDSATDGDNIFVTGIRSRIEIVKDPFFFLIELFNLETKKRLLVALIYFPYKCGTISAQMTCDSGDDCSVEDTMMCFFFVFLKSIFREYELQRNCF